MTKEEKEEDPFELIYDLPECFMMIWEELMGMMSAVGYDICGRISALKSYCMMLYMILCMTLCIT